MADFKAELDELMGAPKAPPQASQGPDFAAELDQMFPEKSSTVSDQVSAFSRAALGPGLESQGLVGGALLGAPFGPPGVVLGAMGGFLVGKLAGRAAEDIEVFGRPLGLGNVDELPENQRAAGFAGRVVGGSAGIAAAPFAAAGSRLPVVAAREGANRLQRIARGAANIPPRMANSIVASAERNPLSFAAQEAGFIGGAAGAEAAAELLAPGNTPVRVAAGIVGGVNPVSRVLTAGTRGARGGLSAAKEALSPQARQARAGDIVRRVIQEFGEDPDTIVRHLARSENLPDQSAVVKGSSKALRALANSRGGQTPQLSTQVATMAEQNLTGLRKALETLEGTGNPAHLPAAARAREMIVRNMLERRAQDAERGARAATSRLEGVRPQDASRAMDDALEGALFDARARERELWGQVNKDIPVEVSNVTQRHAALRDDFEILAEETLDPVIDRAAARLSAEGAEPKSGELMRFRSRMLQESRDAQKSGNFREARLFGEMAEASLDDLSALRSVDPAYDLARTYSREFNDFFTRTFAGRARAQGPGGGRSVPPELVGRRAIGTGREQGDLRLRQLREAAQFSGDEAAQEMIDAQDSFIRAMASELPDPRTGLVTEQRVAAFRAKHSDILQNFPEISSDLTSAERAAARLAQVRSGGDRTRLLLAREIGGDGAAMVRSALSSRDPVSAFARLSRQARRGGPDAIDGLRSTVLGEAFDRAGRNGFSFKKYRREMFSRLGPGRPSLTGLMQREGLLNAAQRNRLRVLVTQAAKVEASIADRGRIDEVVGSVDGLTNLVARIVGANIGGASAAGQVSGAPIVAAGAGSRYIQNLIDRIPAGKIGRVLDAAIKDPRFMATLIETPSSPRHHVLIGRQMNAFLWQNGLLTDGVE